MARIFLDTNVYIDLIKKRTDQELANFQTHDLFISPLSIHILAYTYKYKIPNHELKVNQEAFNILPFNTKIVNQALAGPTDDFEDNVQLHSAAEAECSQFLTRDKELQKLVFFGKTKIVTKIS